MNLFKKLLIAPAALGLLAPMSVMAKEITINDFNPVVQETLLAGGEGLVDDNHNHDGGFSNTTTLSGSAVFAATAIDGASKVNSVASESLQTMYTYTMDLNTSFTGDDNLYVRLRTGNGKVDGGSFYEKTAFYHTDTYSGGVDTLAVDKIWYTTPLGSSEKWSATVGPKIENYYMYAAPVSIYRPGFHKAFKLGSLSGAFGASTKQGIGIKYVGDNGFAASSNIVSEGGATTSGLFTKEDGSKWDTMLAYTKDQYHVSLTLSQQDNDWSSYSYYATSTVKANTTTNADATAYAARAYWRPQESGTATPEISVGYDVISFDGNASGEVKEASSYFVGLGWPDMFQDSDYIGVGFGQPLKSTSTVGGGTAGDDALSPFLWELTYSFKANDSVTIIPTVFGGTDVVGGTDEDIFGAAVTTKFKF